MSPTVPLRTVPSEVVERLAELGAPSEIASVAASYQAMAHRPELLLSWADLSWRLRLHAVAPRALCELAIVRMTSQIPHAEFETRSHVEYALAFGVTQEQLDALGTWQTSPLFSDEERAVLALSDAMHDNEVTDDVVEQLQSCFDPESTIDLIVTCGFYEMVTRVNNALRVY